MCFSSGREKTLLFKLELKAHEKKCDLNVNQFYKSVRTFYIDLIPQDLDVLLS